jgi:hypothetical protein
VFFLNWASLELGASLAIIASSLKNSTVFVFPFFLKYSILPMMLAHSKRREGASYLGLKDMLQFDPFARLMVATSSVLKSSTTAASKSSGAWMKTKLSCNGDSVNDWIADTGMRRSRICTSMFFSYFEFVRM